MVDPATGMIALGAAYGGKDVIAKVLGPTADYLGEGLKDFAQKRVENVKNIFNKASRKLGDEIDNPGSVPPKVLKEVLNDGSYCDDELTAEYFAGVLASSRSGLTRDDRGASFMKLVASLSTYQLRFHYICYKYWFELYKGSAVRPTMADDLDKLWLLMDWRLLLETMDFTQDEPAEEIMLHCITGLKKSDLIEFGAYGPPEFFNSKLSHNCRKVEDPSIQWGIPVRPTQFGIEFWLWANGAGNMSIVKFFDEQVVIDEIGGVNITRKPLKLSTHFDSKEKS